MDIQVFRSAFAYLSALEANNFNSRYVYKTTFLLLSKNVFNFCDNSAPKGYPKA